MSVLKSREELISGKEFYDVLKENHFDILVGVPCSILKGLTDHALIENDIQYIPATREDEAIGIATGAQLGGRNAVVFMQNSGLGISIDALTSLVLLYKIPILLLITWRGFEGKDAPQHILMGKIMMKLLSDINIPSFVLDGDSVKVSKVIKKAVRIMHTRLTPVAIIIRSGILR